MSLRSYAQQIASEEAAEAVFRAGLGLALAPFEAATPEQVRDAIACPLHGKLVGQHCGEAQNWATGGTLGGWVCMSRRIAAARQAVEAG